LAGREIFLFYDLAKKERDIAIAYTNNITRRGALGTIENWLNPPYTISDSILRLPSLVQSDSNISISKETLDVG
jgi:hypothetical protein